eukprot:SAG31_NODE_44690_length_261_cov_3.228395_1_plen_64_part_01
MRDTEPSGSGHPQPLSLQALCLFDNITARINPAVPTGVSVYRSFYILSSSRWEIEAKCKIGRAR